MNSAVNELVRSMVARNSLSDCSVAELQQLASQYPYLGPVQFLLAQKLKEENSPLYPQQSQKAMLYFPDQLWFDYLSGGEDGGGVLSPAKPGEVSAQSLSATVEPISVNSLLAAEPLLLEEKHEPAQEEAIAPLLPATVHEEQMPLVNEAPDSNLQQPETDTPEQVPDSALQQPETDIPGQARDTPDLNPEFALKIQPFVASDKALVFEPYHTVDYFASQGIRFKEEDKPKDRFGQQLKSFTEWLKAMKRLPETEINPVTPQPDDQKVVKLAEHSIADREVVTEAMADVWEKQGNREKAIDIYNKLSLLDPSKNAYFAAKIEQLKNP